MFKKKTGTLLILFLLCVSKISAQVDLTDGPQPPPQAPINNFVFPFFLVVVLLGLYFFYKKKHT